MTASDPRYESPVTGRPSREADLGRVSLPSVLGTSGTLRGRLHQPRHRIQLAVLSV